VRNLALSAAARGTKPPEAVVSTLVAVEGGPHIGTAAGPPEAVSAGAAAVPAVDSILDTVFYTI